MEWWTHGRESKLVVKKVSFDESIAKNIDRCRCDGVRVLVVIVVMLLLVWRGVFGPKIRNYLFKIGPTLCKIYAKELKNSSIIDSRTLPYDKWQPKSA